MKTKFRFIYKLIFGFFVINLFLINVGSANILSDWKDSRAYRPHPILFLHGFASGSPQSWTEAKVDEILNQLYSKYYTGYNSDPTILSSTRFPYLEIINFGSSLIDRNSSIDTYKIGDRYVLLGQRRAGDPGWSDKLNTTIETLRQYYINRDGSRQKIILIAHSMGGLAARKYLKSYSYANQKIDRLIMIGTPNLGSLLVATTTTPYNRNRRWGWYFFPVGWVSSTSEIIVDRLLETRLKIDMHGDAVWDMDPTSTGSGFIRDLNYNYSSLIDHFAIAGKHWLALNLGDTVVSLDSQLGKGVLSLKNKSIIDAHHWNELAISISGDNPILKFLDSTKPEFEITYPEAGTTEIYETSIHIQGKVYKEYLPADSQLTLNVIRQEDGYPLPTQTSFLKPSDLWIPNNPDSPVAEFNEEVNFPGSGTYKISCQVKNPAGIISDSQDVWVKVLVYGTANIIVHCHNPEGKEIASIQGVGQSSVEIYDGNTLIGYGAYNSTTHNQPITISAGSHIIKVKFNGITMEQNINISEGETQVLTFTFERTEILASQLISGSAEGSGSKVQICASNEFVDLLFGPIIETKGYWMGEARVHFLYGGVFVQVTLDVSGGLNVLYPSFHAWVQAQVTPLELGHADVLEWGWEWGEINYVQVNQGRILKSFPSRTDFNEWFIQDSPHADWVGASLMKVVGDSLVDTSPLLSPSIDYSISALSTQRDFNEVWVYFAAYKIEPNPPSRSAFEMKASESVTLPNTLKISSVPYDLDGQAV